MYRCFARFGFDLDISPTHSIVGLCSPLYYYALINDFEYLDTLYAFGSMFWVARWFDLFYCEFHFPLL